MNIEQILNIRSDELHKEYRRPKETRRIIVRGINDCWGADISDYKFCIAVNDRYRYILFVIDEFSRYLWCRKMITKTSDEVLTNLKDIIEKNKNIFPKHLHVDRGTEFYNKDVKNFFEKQGSNIYSTYNVSKSSIVERVQRTIKMNLQKQFTKLQINRWVDIIDDVVETYNNNNKHRSLFGHSPREVMKMNASEQQELFVKMYEDRKYYDERKPKYKVGDFVRIARLKKEFEKQGFSWSTEIYRINKIDKRFPVGYRLEDLKGENIEGLFYESELHPTEESNETPKLIQSVLDQRLEDGKRQELYKYVGYGENFNTWENIEDVKHYKNISGVVPHLRSVVESKKEKKSKNIPKDVVLPEKKGRREIKRPSRYVDFVVNGLVRI